MTLCTALLSLPTTGALDARKLDCNLGFQFRVCHAITPSRYLQSLLICRVKMLLVALASRALALQPGSC